MEAAKQRPPSVMDPTELSMGELYAQAMLDSIPDNAAAEDVAAELEALGQVVDSIPEAQNLLSGWVMPMEERASLIRRLFAGRVSRELEAFLEVLNRRNRMCILPAVVRGFRKLLNTREGKIEVLLTTAQPLDPRQQKEIEEDLAVSLDCRAVVDLKVDEKLVGGAVLRIGDRLYDASIRAQLAKFREKMAGRRTDLKVKDTD